MHSLSPVLLAVIRGSAKLLSSGRSLNFIEVLEGNFATRCVIVIADLNIELSEVRSALSARNAPSQSVAFSHVKVLLHVKDSLLPVSVLFVG